MIMAVAMMITSNIEYVRGTYADLKTKHPSHPLTWLQLRKAGLHVPHVYHLDIQRHETDFFDRTYSCLQEYFQPHVFKQHHDLNEDLARRALGFLGHFHGYFWGFHRLGKSYPF